MGASSGSDKNELLISQYRDTDVAPSYQPITPDQMGYGDDSGDDYGGDDLGSSGYDDGGDDVDDDRAVDRDWETRSYISISI